MVEACAGYDRVVFFYIFPGVFGWKFCNILPKISHIKCTKKWHTLLEILH